MDSQKAFSQRSLLNLVVELGYWPENAACVTQSQDGQLLFWRVYKSELPALALQNPELLAERDPSSLISIGYTDYVHPSIALDQSTAVVSYADFIVELLRNS